VGTHADWRRRRGRGRELQQWYLPLQGGIPEVAYIEVPRWFIAYIYRFVKVFRKNKKTKEIGGFRPKAREAQGKEKAPLAGQASGAG